MEHEVSGYLLAGYVPLRDYGFALPCYRTSNAWYVARSVIDGDHQSAIADFDVFEIGSDPSSRDPIIQELKQSHVTVYPGSPWHDVLLWGGEEFVGTPVEIFDQLSTQAAALAMHAPLTFFDLAIAASLSDVDHIRDEAFSYLRKRYGDDAALRWEQDHVVRRHAIIELRRMINSQGRDDLAADINRLVVERRAYHDYEIIYPDLLLAALDEGSMLEAIGNSLGLLQETVGLQISVRLPTVVEGADIASVNAIWPKGEHAVSTDAEHSPRSWVSRRGKDQYGHWAEIKVRGVTQRLRWIPPGHFLMGSPKDEPERYRNESPQTKINFGQGYWMFDTAVTQRMWRAVMRNNPSRFRRDIQPVEGVNFQSVREFIERLNELCPGLDLYLPSEAQWEYACRAGTTTPYAFGDSAEPEQIHFDIGATIPVATKQPNNWGMYQMHGNVWEWCADVWNDSHKGAARDGAPRLNDSQLSDRPHVVRGGSWLNDAQSVRAAVRNPRAAKFSYFNLGFRCAAGPVELAAPEAEPLETVGILHQQPKNLPSRARVPFIMPTGGFRGEVAHVTNSDVAWASKLGRDRFGLWADLTVEDVTQRLRWIPPGRFVMGSPENEPGRTDDEGPQSDVTIENGYWLFDTSVTQGLWQAVIGQNPSRFVSATRPVEMVSWHHAQDFIARMNERFDGLGLCLPSEAQWEYACRAGTSDATYAGPIEMLGKNHAPVLDLIAWYGGNSGDGFELDNGINSSGWPEKQYTHARAGTRIVKTKQPNAYGLYDMLGNVWEWCADVWQGSLDDTSSDGTPSLNGPQSGEPGRVFRGGSWSLEARYIRAACRSGDGPSGANYFIGFRCAAAR